MDCLVILLLSDSDIRTSTVEQGGKRAISVRATEDLLYVIIRVIIHDNGSVIVMLYLSATDVFVKHKQSAYKQSVHTCTCILCFILLFFVLLWL